MGRDIKDKPASQRERRRNRDGSMGKLNQRMKLPPYMKANPDYHYHWINDDKTNISEAIENDYDFANENGEEVDQRSPDRHNVHVGTKKSGEPLLAYLMRKRKDWYDDDKAAVQTNIDEKMKMIKTNAETDRAKPTGLNIKIS